MPELGSTEGEKEKMGKGGKRRRRKNFAFERKRTAG
jgi:hypothetical protein